MESTLLRRGQSKRFSNVSILAFGFSKLVWIFSCSTLFIQKALHPSTDQIHSLHLHASSNSLVYKPQAGLSPLSGIFLFSPTLLQLIWGAVPIFVPELPVWGIYPYHRMTAMNFVSKFAQFGTWQLMSAKLATTSRCRNISLKNSWLMTFRIDPVQDEVHNSTVDWTWPAFRDDSPILLWSTAFPKAAQIGNFLVPCDNYHATTSKQQFLQLLRLVQTFFCVYCCSHTTTCKMLALLT